MVGGSSGSPAPARDAGFQSARAAQQVAGHGLGAADLEFVAQRVLAEDRFNGRDSLPSPAGVEVAWAFT
jgi:hypothetical protein